MSVLEMSVPIPLSEIINFTYLKFTEQKEDRDENKIGRPDKSIT